MNKMKKVIALAACATMVATLSGCTKSAKYTKVGFGTVIETKEKEGALTQVDTTMVTLGLDSKGKIQYMDLDVAQQKIAKPDELRTKEEQKEDYAMKPASEKKDGGIGKEWYEQAEAYEKFAIGKTVEELTAADIADEKGYPKNADLAAGCTMNISAFQEAVKKAAANAVEVKGAEKIGAGEVITVSAKGQVNNDMVSVALDSKGKVVWANIDTAQSLNKHDETKTKKELKTDYGMTKASPIGKELFEQLEFFEKFVQGKTGEEIAAIETYEKDANHPAAVKDADLATGCTINIGGYKEAFAEAIKNAK